MLLRTKALRSDYFNAGRCPQTCVHFLAIIYKFMPVELGLFSSMDAIGHDVVRFDPGDGSRRARLRELLEKLNESALGLYFPSNSFRSNQGETDRTNHYQILNLLHDEAIALNSRDKAPFLLQVEVAATGFYYLGFFVSNC